MKRGRISLTFIECWLLLCPLLGQSNGYPPTWWVQLVAIFSGNLSMWPFYRRLLLLRLRLVVFNTDLVADLEFRYWQCTSPAVRADRGLYSRILAWVHRGGGDPWRPGLYYSNSEEYRVVSICLRSGIKRRLASGSRFFRPSAIFRQADSSRPERENLQKTGKTGENRPKAGEILKLSEQNNHHKTPQINSKIPWKWPKFFKKQVKQVKTGKNR